MLFYKLVFLAFTFVGNPQNGDINLSHVSVAPNSFDTKELCEEAFDAIRAQNLTERFAHTCAPVVVED